MKKNTRRLIILFIVLIIAIFIVPVQADTIVPLCPAGMLFDSSKYAQNTPQSDPMIFTCNWDGTVGCTSPEMKVRSQVYMRMTDLL